MLLITLPSKTRTMMYVWAQISFMVGVRVVIALHLIRCKEMANGIVLYTRTIRMLFAMPEMLIQPFTTMLGINTVTSQLPILRTELAIPCLNNRVGADGSARNCVTSIISILGQEAIHHLSTLAHTLWDLQTGSKEAHPILERMNMEKKIIGFPDIKLKKQKPQFP